MEYRDLADDTPVKTWDVFLRAEEEYKRDPKNREKYLKAREAFKAYDAVRVRINFPGSVQ